MSMVYDSWEKLVGAVLKREAFRQLARAESFSTISTSPSFDSALEDDPDHCEKVDPEAHPSDSGLPQIKFKEIKKATKNFKNNMWIGAGAFGNVFKGWIDVGTLKASKHGSGTAIAVKRWRPESMHGHEEWLKEINYLSKLHHPNLIVVMGYCSEENNHILVYEFMSKGSLENHLSGRGHHPLSWATRIRVATDVAKGLSFLHNLPTPVIHRGVQCGNILLDGEFNAKLSDFGLARDGPTGDMTHVSTAVRSSNTCIAPEYALTGHLTTKCDVYSFGYVLLELLSGRRGMGGVYLDGERIELVDWAKQLFGDRKGRKFMDSKLEDEYPHLKAYTVWKLALQCLSSVPEKRPTMTEVLLTLME